MPITISTTTSRPKIRVRRIFAGAIVQPTPLRLEYLDEVLTNYWEMFGEALPADGWAIHNFILNERNCAYYEGDASLCWGADIPPGNDAHDGLVITVHELQKTADVPFFEAQVHRFRQWMADNGYRNRPLYISEFGILMPESYGFPPSLVTNYMTKTFDFLINTKDEKLGYAADDNRLVQRLSWYSTIDPSFNGSLFESTTGSPLAPPFKLTSMGEHYRDYASAVPVSSAFKLLSFSQQVPVGITAGEGVTLTLKAAVGNSGNNQWPAGATVRFYLGRSCQRRHGTGQQGRADDRLRTDVNSRIYLDRRTRIRRRADDLRPLARPRRRYDDEPARCAAAGTC